MPQPLPSPKERENPKAKANNKVKEKAVARKATKDDLAIGFLKEHFSNSIVLATVPRGVTVHTFIWPSNRR